MASGSLVGRGRGLKKDCRRSAKGLQTQPWQAASLKSVNTLPPQLDPNDPKNPVIADIAWAEKNPAAGRVAYSTDFFILKPNQLSKGNHKVFFEAPNCGGKVFTDFNDAACQG